MHPPSLPCLPLSPLQWSAATSLSPLHSAGSNGASLPDSTFHLHDFSPLLPCFLLLSPLLGAPPRHCPSSLPARTGSRSTFLPDCTFPLVSHSTPISLSPFSPRSAATSLSLISPARWGSEFPQLNFTAPSLPLLCFSHASPFSPLFSLPFNLHPNTCHGLTAPLQLLSSSTLLMHSPRARPPLTPRFPLTHTFTVSPIIEPPDTPPFINRLLRL